MAKEGKKPDPHLPPEFNLYGTVQDPEEGGWRAVTFKITNVGPQLQIAESYIASVPDMRPLAQEQFKIAVGKAWGRGE